VPTFRKKPVAISATQWFPGTDVPGVFFHDRHPDRHEYELRGRTGNYCVETLEGTMKVTPGDWIITGIKGELYPCKPDIFERTYEPADENALAAWQAAYSSQIGA
jgi:hypothetical protein